METSEASVQRQVDRVVRADEPTDLDWDDWNSMDEVCWLCGGDGVVEYIDTPEVWGEVWGEDCPAEENHLVTCPDCGGTGA